MDLPGRLGEPVESAAYFAVSEVLTNAVKHFKFVPRGKRRLHKTPAQREISACHVWLEEELARHGEQGLAILGDYNIAPDDRDLYDPDGWAGNILVSEPERAAFYRLDIDRCGELGRCHSHVSQFQVRQVGQCRTQ